MSVPIVDYTVYALFVTTRTDDILKYKLNETTSVLCMSGTTTCSSRTAICIGMKYYM